MVSHQRAYRTSMQAYCPIKHSHKNEKDGHFI